MLHYHLHTTENMVHRHPTTKEENANNDEFKWYTSLGTGDLLAAINTRAPTVEKPQRPTALNVVRLLKSCMGAGKHVQQNNNKCVLSCKVKRKYNDIM